MILNLYFTFISQYDNNINEITNLNNNRNVKCSKKMQVHLPNPDTEFVEEQLDNGHIKKYIKGRTLGKVTFLTFRVDLLNATNLYLNKQANTMLLRLLINRPLEKEKPNKNCSLRS